MFQGRQRSSKNAGTKKLHQDSHSGDGWLQSFGRVEAIQAEEKPYNLRVEKTTDITKRLHRIKTKIAVDATELIAKY